jgi:hypothetical protein
LNILTKICIVVLLLVSLVASTIFLAQATVPENYREVAGQWKDRYTAEADVHGRTQDELRAERDLRAVAEDAENRAEAALARERTERLQVLENITNEVDKVWGAWLETKRQIENVNQTIQFFDQRTSVILEMYKTVRAEYNDMLKVKAELEDDLRQEKAKSARLEGQWRLALEQVQALNETIADLNSKITELETKISDLLIQRPQRGGEGGAPTPMEVGGIGGGSADTVMFPHGAGETKIVGKVIAVRDDLVSISVGKVHGVKPGMKMVVSNGGNLVGFLRVEVVETGQSAGILVDRQLEPQVHDRVEWPSPAPGIQ